MLGGNTLLVRMIISSFLHLQEASAKLLVSWFVTCIHNNYTWSRPIHVSTHVRHENIHVHSQEGDYNFICLCMGEINVNTSFI